MPDEDSNRPPEIRDPGGDAQGSTGEQSPLQARAAFLANWDWESVVRLNRGVCERGRAQHGTNSESAAAVSREWQQRRVVETSLGRFWITSAPVIGARLPGEEPPEARGQIILVPIDDSDDGVPDNLDVCSNGVLS